MCVPERERVTLRGTARDTKRERSKYSSNYTVGAKTCDNLRKRDRRGRRRDAGRTRSTADRAKEGIATHYSAGPLDLASG